ncbi:MAG: M48 family metalloprotease [Desulfobacterales bacterium]
MFVFLNVMKRRKVVSVFFPLIAVMVVSGCYTEPSPLTGEKERYGYTWEQELALGKEADMEISKQLGVYEDEAVQAYVESVGERVLSGSDFRKPDVPERYRGVDFTFRVIDASTVNAFALPGGYVYVTRGLLAHAENEAQLAMVLGHEIGHIAGRHAAQQALKATWSQLGLIGATILGQAALGEEAGQNLLGVGSTVLQLLLNKYSREDEREADRLGLRYTAELGYDTREGAGFFRTLDRMAAATGSRIPNWQSTHPEPGEREETILELSRRLAAEYPMAIKGREAFLSRIDGMVVGDNPREGFVENGIFYHPDLRFRLDVPGGWKVQNETRVVLMGDPENQAAIILEIAAASSIEAAAAELANGRAIQVLSRDRTLINGLQGLHLEATAQTQQGTVYLVDTFIEYDRNIYSIMGITPSGRAERYRTRFLEAASSFRPLEDQRYLAVEPHRLAIVQVDRPASFREFVPETLPPGMSAEELAIMNQVTLETWVQPGTALKIPEG